MISFKQFIAEEARREGESYFSDSALDAAKNPKYDPTVRRPGYNPEYTKVVHMHPKDFLHVARNGVDSEKTKNVAAVLNRSEKFSDLPELHFKHSGDGEARVSGHEGRHRARALLHMGVTSMPVVLQQSYNGDVPPVKFNEPFEGIFPTVLHGERGPDAETSLHSNHSIPFPTKDHRI